MERHIIVWSSAITFAIVMTVLAVIVRAFNIYWNTEPSITKRSRAFFYFSGFFAVLFFGAYIALGPEQPDASGIPALLKNQAIGLSFFGGTCATAFALFGGFGWWYFHRYKLKAGESF